MKSTVLETKTRKELARIARDQGIKGWHEMRKSRLLLVLRRRLAHGGSLALRNGNGHATPRTLPAAVAPARSALMQGSTLSNGHNGHRPTVDELKTKKTLERLGRRTLRELRQLAGRHRINGWRTMRKDRLIRALARRAAQAVTKSLPAPRQPADATDVVPVPMPLHGNNGLHDGRIHRSLFRSGAPTRILASRAQDDYGRSRIVTMVRDPYWLHVYWEITRPAVDRAARALGQHWYSAQPILRLLDVTSEDGSSVSERVLRDIVIHGGVNNWYIDVDRPPCSFRVDIGYQSQGGRFFALARSNVVTTPAAGTESSIDEHWQSVRDESGRVYALSASANPSTQDRELEAILAERGRPIISGSLAHYGSGALGDTRDGFHFQLDAELIVFGSTDPDGKLSLQGEPVELGPDGSFKLRFSMPEGRHIITAVAQTRNGIEERTKILAFERNTKCLEPTVHDGQDA